MKIIIVDDEHILLKHLEKRVREITHCNNIKTYDNCNDVLEEIKTEFIDIAFLDIQMTGMNGMELAEILKKKFPRINIIFTTGHENFAVNAFNLNASAYLLKPITNESIRKALANLRYPVTEDIKSKIQFQCFGNFEVFYNSKPVEFKFNKTKEFLAYLVYKRGALCSNEEIISVLWDDFKQHNSYFKQLRQDLDNSLSSIGCNNILIWQRGKIGINTKIVECDYYEYLNGGKAVVKEFMTQYSWAEDVTALL